MSRRFIEWTRFRHSRRVQADEADPARNREPGIRFAFEPVERGTGEQDVLSHIGGGNRSMEGDVPGGWLGRDERLDDRSIQVGPATAKGDPRDDRRRSVDVINSVLRIEQEVTIGGKILPVRVGQLVPPDGALMRTMSIVPMFELGMAQQIWPDMSEVLPDVRQWVKYARRVDGQCEELMHQGRDVKFCVLSPLAYVDWARTTNVAPPSESLLSRFIDESLLPWLGPSSCIDEANAWQLEIMAKYFGEQQKVDGDQLSASASRIASELMDEVLRVADGPGTLTFSLGVSPFLKGYVSMSMNVEAKNGVLLLSTRYAMNVIQYFCKVVLFRDAVVFWRFSGAETKQVYSWSLSLAGVRGNSALETAAIAERIGTFGEDVDICYADAPEWLNN